MEMIVRFPQVLLFLFLRTDSITYRTDTKAKPGYSIMFDVLIIHTSEASEWAEYLRQILVASRNFLEGSIILYDLNEGNLLESQDLFDSSKCIMPLLSAVVLDMQNEPEVMDTLQKFLHPPDKVVAFLCGISECDVTADYFEHWEYWRKLSSEDEPSVYVSTVLECIDNGCISAHYDQEPADTDLQENINELTLSDFPEFIPLPDETEEQQENKDEVSSPSTTEETVVCPSEPQDEQSCLTIQPNRILCRTHVNIYIIMAKRLEDTGRLEVEFHSQHSTPKRISGTLVNEYIVTVLSPDMPAGNVSLTLYNNESVVCSINVIYYTEMEEICRYLENATDPVHFMCQAFNITSNVSETLDNLLVDSLKERMPLNGLQVFGINQIAQENTSANQRNVELPTLLHFSAKHGLKKLTSLLMQCPGALQAYSVMNKDGDYPNKLAEKSGFADLRQFMDEYVATVDLVKTHIEETENSPEDIYEDMLTSSQTSSQFIANFENEDIYECMMQLNPEMDDVLESALECSNPEETMLRKFFEARPEKCLQSLEHKSTNGGLPEMDDEEYHDMGLEIYGETEEEDPYNPCLPDQIYDTVEPQSDIPPEVLNRPPAPIPRPANMPEPEENTAYITKVFCPKEPLYSVSKRPERNSSLAPAQLVRDRDMSSRHDPFAGMKTPGQRQLISLQERVKVGELTVEDAVQEFKSWQFDQDRRSQSLRFQQDNLQKLRESITRRCRDKGTSDLMITAPMQTNVQWGTTMNCEVYEPTPRLITQPPPVRPLQRGTWQTGSTSSTSSSSSHRLSIQSTISNSSGPEGDCEEPPDIPLPPRPTRPVVNTPPILPPPRIPPRLPERNPEISNERYVSTPARAVHQTPPQRPMPPPPIPRRTW